MMGVHTYVEEKKLVEESNSFYTRSPISCIQYPTEDDRTARRIILAELDRRQDIKIRKKIIRLTTSMLESIYNSFLIFDEIRKVRLKVEERITNEYLKMSKKEFNKLLNDRIEVNKREISFHFEHCLITDTLEKFGLPTESEFGLAIKKGERLEFDSNTDLKAIEDYMYEIVNNHYFNDFSYPSDRVIVVEDPEESVETIGV